MVIRRLLLSYVVIISCSGYYIIMEADDNNIAWFTYTGEEEIPDEVTHVIIAVRTIPKEAFRYHPSIIQVICGENVEKVEENAFEMCDNLRRVIMPGVKEIEWCAFTSCRVLTDIECGKLEIIGEYAFGFCFSLSSIDLPSIKIVERHAFSCCTALTNVKFGKELESIRGVAFFLCHSLERITLPLKDGMITDNDIFQQCFRLNHIDLVGGVHETIAALLMEEWKNDMNEEIGTICQNLASAWAGDALNEGGKTRAIRWWIRSVLGKIVHYKSEHRRYLNVAAALEPSLPNDIMLNNVLPFLAYTFDGEHLEDEDEPSPTATHEPALRQE